MASYPARLGGREREREFDPARATRGGFLLTFHFVCVRSTWAKERKTPRIASHLHHPSPCSARARRVLAQTLGVLRPSGARWSGVESRRVARPALPAARAGDEREGEGPGQLSTCQWGVCRARGLARDSCYLVVTMLRHRAEQHRESGGLRPRGARGLGASEVVRSALISRRTHGRRCAMGSLAVWMYVLPL